MCTTIHSLGGYIYFFLRRGDGSGGLPSSIENRGMGHLRKLLDEMLHQQVRASAADKEESYG